eukprot:TRINITY_DN13685_c0_g2_i1.p1 TRINITY_DN13685_c0_g2~~TRINITY_DN13685_c0_g2_i1.p1  ORF type:complete len:438 (+),score=90.68 TRINITY_DN13685_c0_g2_i1:848-2161(+)
MAAVVAGCDFADGATGAGFGCEKGVLAATALIDRCRADAAGAAEAEALAAERLADMPLAPAPLASEEEQRAGRRAEARERSAAVRALLRLERRTAGRGAQAASQWRRALSEYSTPPRAPPAAAGAPQGRLAPARRPDALLAAAVIGTEVRRWGDAEAVGQFLLPAQLHWDLRAIEGAVPPELPAQEWRVRAAGAAAAAGAHYVPRAVTRLSARGLRLAPPPRPPQWDVPLLERLRELVHRRRAGPAAGPEPWEAVVEWAAVGEGSGSEALSQPVSLALLRRAAAPLVREYEAQSAAQQQRRAPASRRSRLPAGQRRLEDCLAPGPGGSQLRAQPPPERPLTPPPQRAAGAGAAPPAPRKLKRRRSSPSPESPRTPPRPGGPPAAPPRRRRLDAAGPAAPPDVEVISVSDDSLGPPPSPRPAAIDLTLSDDESGTSVQ